MKGGIVLLTEPKYINPMWGFVFGGNKIICIAIQNKNLNGWIPPFYETECSKKFWITYPKITVGNFLSHNRNLAKELKINGYTRWVKNSLILTCFDMSPLYLMKKQESSNVTLYKDHCLVRKCFICMEKFVSAKFFAWF